MFVLNAVNANSFDVSLKKNRLFFCLEFFSSAVHTVRPGLREADGGTSDYFKYFITVSHLPLGNSFLLCDFCPSIWEVVVQFLEICSPEVMARGEVKGVCVCLSVGEYQETMVT